MMYKQGAINYQKQQSRQNRYFFAVNAWAEMPLEDQEAALVACGHHKVNAQRSFNHMYKNVRESLVDFLNIGATNEATI